MINKELRHTTHGIVHAGFSDFRRSVARKNRRCKLLGKCLVIPHDTIPSNVGGKFRKKDNTIYNRYN